MNLDDLMELEGDGGLHVVDPDLTRVEPTPLKPLPAAPVGPTRKTTFVPSGATSLHMGHEIRSPADPSVVTFDKGIVGKTDRHVHFHTTGAKVGSSEPTASAGISADAGVTEATFLRLGEPSATFEPTSATVRSVVPVVHDTWAGYAMITGGGAIQESRENMFLISGANDIRAVAKRRFIVGTPGDIIISADSGATTAELVGSTGISSNGASPSNWQRVAIAFFEGAITLEGAAQTQALLVQKMTSLVRRQPLEGNPGWKEVSTGSKVGIVLGQVVNLWTLISPFKGLILEKVLGTEPGGAVSIYGSSSISLGAMLTAGLHSTLMTSVDSPTVTTVTGGAVLSLSSSGVALLSGGWLTSIGASAVSVDAQLGAATFRARDIAEISSSHGKLLATSLKDAQLNSIDGRVLIHGKEGVYIGAGRGPQQDFGSGEAIRYQTWGGFALNLEAGGLKLGYARRVTDFTAPEFDRDDVRMLWMSQSEIVLRNGRAAISLSNGDLVISVSGRVRHEATPPVPPPPPPPPAPASPPAQAPPPPWAAG